MRVIEFLKDIFVPGKTVYVKEKLQSEKYKLDITDFSIQMAINMIAGLIAKCEFKTYLNSKEIKADEYYLWNIQPNVNQNSSEFIQEFVSKLLRENEVLVVEVNGQLLIADSFNRTKYALFPDTFSSVSARNLTFDKTFNMSDVLYFRLNDINIQALLSGVMAGYSDLLNMAIGKYKRAGGRKGTAKVNKGRTGDKEYEQKINDFFNHKMKRYFENENAVAVVPNGVDYNEIAGEGSKKSISEVSDIANITKEAIAMVAHALKMPPALLQGDIADVDKLIDELLTVCIDPLIDLIETETNRKRYGKAYLSGSYLKIDTTCMKHVDIFSIAVQADKLISDGLYSIDELRQKLSDLPVNTWWSQKHYMTKNYSGIEAANSPPDNTNSKNKGDETDETS